MRRRRGPGRSGGRGSGRRSRRRAPRAAARAPEPEPDPPSPSGGRCSCCARIPVRGLRPVLAERLRGARVVSGGSQPVLGEYAARLDPAHLGLGGLRVGGVGEWARRGRARRFGVPGGVRSARGDRGASPGGSHLHSPRSLGALAPLPSFPSRRAEAPRAGVAPRSPGMRARESPFGPTAEAPEVTTNFFAFRGPCCAPGKDPGKGGRRKGTGPLLAPEGLRRNFEVPPLHTLSHAGFPTRLNASNEERGP